MNLKNCRTHSKKGPRVDDYGRKKPVWRQSQAFLGQFLWSDETKNESLLS